MIENLKDPAILFFIIGLLAGIVKSDLKLPEAIYEIISIYLLLAIGLKGGVQLAETNLTALIIPATGAISVGLIIPVIAYLILRRIGKFNKADSAAIAAHYGSVSAVTFAVVLIYLDRIGVRYEEYTTVLLVLLEIPAIAVGIFIARLRASKTRVSYGKLVHEVIFGKSIYLLLSGLVAGYILGPQGIASVKIVFFDPFKGALTFFLLEMGLVASRRLSDLKSAGTFLIVFGIFMPLISGTLGTVIGYYAGLSIGGTAVLATLAGSASYIAAPAAMRIAVPEANPTYYLTASLVVTFPFNLIFGIPIYYWMSLMIH
ncbi:MAG: sodium-dependent bicarbonate transport family permease [Melioribacteraceae bacterium]|nr:sodium-dependent bicarbonate transport family permease [Melioribacteraceae bacterium]